MAARQNKARIIPFLLNGVKPLTPSSLPTDLKWLSNRQAITLSGDHWSDDLWPLLRLIAREIPLKRRAAERPKNFNVRQPPGGFGGGVVRRNPSSDWNRHCSSAWNGFFRLQKGGRSIAGLGEFAFDFRSTRYVFKVHLKGGLRYDRFLKLDYKNTNESAIQFGSIMAQLSDDGHELEGQFLGYGAVSRRIVHGTFHV